MVTVQVLFETALPVALNDEVDDVDTDDTVDDVGTDDTAADNDDDASTAASVTAAAPSGLCSEHAIGASTALTAPVDA